MGETSQGLTFPTKADIVKLNREHIQRTGGNRDRAGQFHNENSLSWVLEAIQHPLFGQHQYPTVAEKAAILAWAIINSHVFMDGNKRTGMMTMMIFLRQNGFILQASDDEIIKVAVQVANAREENFTQAQFTKWVQQHIRPIVPST